MQKRNTSLVSRKGVSRSFWKARPVFVTGVTGFVGSWLAARLVREGTRVVGLAWGKTAGSNFNRLGLAKKITVVRGRLENFPLLQRIIQKHSIEIVYHLGAQTIVGVANQSPLPTFKANIEGTWNLLESCRGGKNVRAVIVASSDKAYGVHKKLPYQENFPLQAEYPYDVSKACADLLARSYFKTYGLPVVVTRFANIYGPGDLHFSRIIPDTIRSILQGKHPIVRSDGTPERDYLYIDDVVELYLLLAQRIKQVQGEAFNAGWNHPISVRALVDIILRLAGRADLQPKILGSGTPHGEIDRQWLDARKAKRPLGWKPRVSLEEGLRRTLAWHRVLS